MPSETPDSDPHEHEIVVVTGASAGLGRGIAREFAKAGAAVGLIARDRDRPEQTAREVADLTAKLRNRASNCGPQPTVPRCSPQLWRQLVLDT